ncbi:MAG: CocE/NonD family hydrolase [Chloroflexi bacterium]|nr:CocE/NonD family hydrolase [Chloroflexota bacterium]
MKKILLVVFLIVLFACAVAGLALASRQAAERQSLYVTMSDGTDIAIDLWLPTDLASGEKLPTVMKSTGYWRSFGLTPVGEVMEKLEIAPGEVNEGPLWAQAGYALVLVDIRGTGASYGQWKVIWSEREIADLGEIVDWIIAQPWSNGKVGAYGVSYDGNLAEMMATLQHPAIKAVAPQYSDFDLYNGIVRPGGVFNSGFMDGWRDFHNGLGANDVCVLETASGVDCEQMSYLMTGVRPVDTDADGRMLSDAVAEHTHIDVYQVAREIEFSDDVWSDTDLTLGDLSPYSYKTAIENSNVPMYVWVGWLDSATTDGALSRYMTFSNPQKVLIGPWSHGGGHHTDPFLPDDTAVEPSVEKQFQMLVDFFDLYLKDNENPDPDTGIEYYTMGEGTWKTTHTWPPDGFTPTSWYLGESGTLVPQPPDDESAADEYQVHWDTTTGDLSRWYTGLFKSDVVYADRAAEDQKLLTYTSDPMSADVEITGNPVVTLHVASSTPDAAFHVYLEDVAPDGRVTYITEGILRGVHRRVSDQAPYVKFGTYHSMESVDAVPMVPGEVTEISFKLHATSVLIEQGHRIRVAIAGHDGSVFERYPADETPIFTVQRNSLNPSFILLPMQQR